MSSNLMKVPTMLKVIDLRHDTPVGQRVTLDLGNLHGLTWKAFYTIQSTAKGLFELKCTERSLSRWSFNAHVEATFKGISNGPTVIETDLLFTERKTEIALEPIEEGRKYTRIELKMTRMEVSGVHPVTFINFDQKNKWLDVLIRDEDSQFKLYANSSVLALNSPILREQFEKEMTGNHEVLIPKCYFAGMRQLLNFLHPPYICKEEKFEIDTENAISLAISWKMDTAVKAWEDMLIANRRSNKEGFTKSVRFAEKFRFRKLLEEVVHAMAIDDIYILVKENKFCNWIRAALFDELMNEADSDTSYSDSDESNEEAVLANAVDIIIF